MKAIILAAGRGSRMKSLTDERPKCLVELKGRTLLSRQLDALRGAGIDQIAIVTGYRREMLADKADAEFHNPRWADTNMVASLAAARDWLQEAPTIVSYSDIFYDADVVGSLMGQPDALALSYDPDWRALWSDRFGDPLLDAETFRLGADNHLTEIGAKPKTADEVEGQYMGLLRFTPEGWAEMEAMLADLPDDRRDKIDMTSALQAIISRGRVPIRAVAQRGVWGEVDSADDLSLYEDGAG